MEKMNTTEATATILSVTEVEANTDESRNQSLQLVDEAFEATDCVDEAEEDAEEVEVEAVEIIAQKNAAHAAKHPVLKLDLSKADRHGLALGCFYDYSQDKQYGLSDTRLIITAADMAFKQVREERELAVRIVNCLMRDIQPLVSTDANKLKHAWTEAAWKESGLTREGVRAETAKMLLVLGFESNIYTSKHSITITW